MVALSVIAIMLCALTADYVVQRLALRAFSKRAVHATSDVLDGIFGSPRHLWIRPEPSGVARVGADNVWSVLLTRPWRIDWAPLGQIKRGESLAVLHGQGRSLTLRSPISGEVFDQNTQLGKDAASVSSDGWLVRLRPEESLSEISGMRTGRSLGEWSRSEMDRLREFVLARLPVTAVGATAADGGPLAADVASRIDDTSWNEAVRLMLGEDALLLDLASDQPALAKQVRS